MLIIDNTVSADPEFNLALEEYLTGFSQDIFMLWQNYNAVIVGKNQNTLSEINNEYLKEKNIRVVRRLSGGGAVYHDAGNLNFSFILNDDGGRFSDYKSFLIPIVNTLKSIGIDAYLSGRNDLLIDGKKISGNAQYFKNGRLLHHGTLLFSTDFDVMSEALKVDAGKIESKGIKSISSRVTNICEYTGMNMASFRASVLGSADGELYTLSDADINAVNHLKQKKYGTWEWNFSYSPAYNFRKSIRTGGGSVSAEINVKNGIITDICFFGDFFGKRDLSEFREHLRGMRHEESCLLDRIRDCGDFFSGISPCELIRVLI